MFLGDVGLRSSACSRSRLFFLFELSVFSLDDELAGASLGSLDLGCNGLLSLFLGGFDLEQSFLVPLELSGLEVLFSPSGFCHFLVSSASSLRSGRFFESLCSLEFLENLLETWCGDGLGGLLESEHDCWLRFGGMFGFQCQKRLVRLWSFS